MLRRDGVGEGGGQGELGGERVRRVRRGRVPE